MSEVLTILLTKNYYHEKDVNFLCSVCLLMLLRV